MVGSAFLERPDSNAALLEVYPIDGEIDDFRYSGAGIPKQADKQLVPLIRGHLDSKERLRLRNILLWVLHCI
jgi:hypothetical protein